MGLEMPCSTAPTPNNNAEFQYQTSLLCRYELAWTLAQMETWGDAGSAFYCLYETNNWSKCFYVYASAVCKLMAGESPSFIPASFISPLLPLHCRLVANYPAPTSSFRKQRRVHPLHETGQIVLPPAGNGLR